MSFREGLDDQGTYYQINKVEGTTPILFIHGVGLDHSIWEPQIKFFKDQTTITYDLIGHGLSTSRTKNIRIGLAAAIATFWNPLRLAEDVALLDNLAGGRLDVGLGRGVFGKEAIHMNIEADLKDQPKNFRLFVETLDILTFLEKRDPNWSND